MSKKEQITISGTVPENPECMDTLVKACSDRSSGWIRMLLCPKHVITSLIPQDRVEYHGTQDREGLGRKNSVNIALTLKLNFKDKISINL